MANESDCLIKLLLLCKEFTKIFSGNVRMVNARDVPITIIVIFLKRFAVCGATTPMCLVFRIIIKLSVVMMSAGRKQPIDVLSKTIQRGIFPKHTRLASLSDILTLCDFIS